jgi:mRNA interferase RelE/StbE
MTQPASYTVVLTPAARRRLSKLPLPAATALFEHLTGPVAENPYRLSKPLDTPFDQVRSVRRDAYRPR